MWSITWARNIVIIIGNITHMVINVLMLGLLLFLLLFTIYIIKVIILIFIILLFRLFVEWVTAASSDWQMLMNNNGHKVTAVLETWQEESWENVYAIH